jgi:predicted GNAT superfamily acetyltransferase
VNGTSELAIRRLAGDDDYEQCIRLQRETWGQDFTECVPKIALMIIAAKTGGVLAGGFDGGRLVGFVLGMTGFVDRRPMHWSHMLAVTPAYRRTGLGRRLKLFQRTQLLADGIDVVFWTFDPLEAGNAHLNMNRLGVTAERYVEDIYGADSSSELHSGLGTDRLIVRWDLEDDRVRTILSRGRSVGLSLFQHAKVVNAALDADGRPAPRDTVVTSDSAVRVEVPSNIRACKAESSETAFAWRTSTRAAFQRYLSNGYRIADFYRDPVEQRCYYILRSTASMSSP